MNNDDKTVRSPFPDPSRRRWLSQVAKGLSVAACVSLGKSTIPATEADIKATPEHGPKITTQRRSAVGTSATARSLGIFTHIVPGDHPAKARAVREAGFDCVQWYPALDKDELTEASFRRVAAAYAAEGVAIAAVSGYANLFDPRPDVRSTERERLRQILRLAPVCGCPLVCTETGTLNPKRGSHPDNTRPEIWNEFVDLTGQYLDEASRADSKLVLEAYTKNVCRDAQDIARLLDAVKTHPSLRFVMDPFNIAYEHELEDLRLVLQQYFDLVGPLCPIAHAKDLMFENGDKVTPRAGSGVFDWACYAEFLERELPRTPLILEHLKWPEAGQTLSFVQEQLRIAKASSRQ